MSLIFCMFLWTLFPCKLICQDSDQFPLPLPTELVISRGYAASFQQWDPKLAFKMLIVLQIRAWKSFKLSLIDNDNKEVVVFGMTRGNPKATATYYAGPVTGSTVTKNDLVCHVPENDTNWEFYMRLEKAPGEIEYSCGKYPLKLETKQASSHLWQNLVKVRLTGEGDFASLTYVPLEIPEVKTYSSQWAVPLPGKKHLARGDKLEVAFKVIHRWHPYFFTLSASGSNDHWLCYVRTDMNVRLYYGPCWDAKADWYRDTHTSLTTRNMPPLSDGTVFYVQIIYTGTHYKVFINSEYSAEFLSHKSWQEAPTRMIYSNGYLEMLWIKFLH